MALNSKNIPEYVQVVVNPYGGNSSQNRKGVMIGGPWVDDIVDFIQANGIKAIYLNSAKGWKGTDYSFLSDLNDVEELNIISSTATGLQAVEGMRNLVQLSITTSTKDKVDFSKLSNLEWCYLYWWNGAESIFNCYRLRTLYLDNFKLKDLSKLSLLSRLESLTVANCQIETLEWLASLSCLRELELYNLKTLSTFLPIKSCATLRKLAISGSKLLFDLSFLEELKDIEILDFSDNGELASLAPLAKLSNLKALSFAGTTVIRDGDLNVLECLPKLSMLMFQGKKHYTHKLVKKWDWSNFDSPSVLLERI